jgi:subtilisin family serine protease
MDPQWIKSWGLFNHGQSIPNWGNGKQGMDIHVESAWKVSTGNKKVTVAILDSGYQKNHEDLQNNLSINPQEIPDNQMDDDGNGWVDDTWGWNFIDQNNSPLDDNGHGSFCAGIIGSDWENGKGTRGINQAVNLVPVKTLDFLGQGSTASAIEGIEYALSRGAQIINMSWGGTRFDPALYESIKTAIKKDVLFVAAAGNSAKNNDDSENSIYPASFDLPSLISVAAYDPRGERALFSNFGNKTVHVGAPGVEIFGVDLTGYRYRSGTSFAAPHVTGVAALMKAASPNLEAKEIKNRILKSGTPLHPYEKYYTSTGAFLNAENAIRNISTLMPSPPMHWRKINLNWGTHHPYLPNYKYSFRVVEPGAVRMRLHFKKFQLEKEHDQLVIRDKEKKTVFVYTGNLGDFTSVDILSDEAELEFQSDYNRQEYGFDLDYYEAVF